MVTQCFLAWVVFFALLFISQKKLASAAMLR